MNLKIVKSLLFLYNEFSSLQLTNGINFIYLEINLCKKCVVEILSKISINPSIAYNLLKNEDYLNNIIDYYDDKSQDYNYSIISKIYHLLFILPVTKSLFSSSILHNSLKIIRNSERNEYSLTLKLYDINNYPDICNAIQSV